MSQKFKAVKNLFFSSASQYIEAFFTLICAVIIARSLGPSSYGDYALVIWMCALGIKLTNGGVATSLVKFVSECKVKSPEYIHGVLQYCRRIQTIKLVLVTLFTLIFFKLLYNQIFSDISIVVFIFLLLAIVIRTYYMYYISMLKGFQKFKGNAVAMAIASPINLALVIIAAYFFDSLEAFILIYIIVSSVYLLVSMNVVKKFCVFDKSNLKLPSSLKTRIKKHSSIVMITTLLTFLVTRESELLFLEIFASDQDLGFFKVAHRLGFTIALLLPGIFSGILLPLMSSSVATSREITASRYLASFKYVAILAFPAAFFLVIYANHIITILYGEEYSAAIIPFMIIVGACCLTSFGAISSSYLLSIDKQNVILKITIFATFIKLSLDYLLIVNYQLIGAAAAFAISNFVIFLAILIYSLRQLGLSLPYFHFVKLITASIIASGVSLLMPEVMNEIIYIFCVGIIFVVIYGVLTLVMKCWAREELYFLCEKIDATNFKLLVPLSRFLRWSAA